MFTCEYFVTYCTFFYKTMLVNLSCDLKYLMQILKLNLKIKKNKSLKQALTQIGLPIVIQWLNKQHRILVVSLRILLYFKQLIYLKTQTVIYIRSVYLQCFPAGLNFKIKNNNLNQIELHITIYKFNGQPQVLAVSL